MSRLYYLNRFRALSVEKFGHEWAMRTEEAEKVDAEMASIKSALLSMKYEPRKEVRISTNDPENSVSLFDTNRQNEFGEHYCVAPDILDIQVDVFWQTYVDDLKQEERENVKPTKT